MKATQKPWTEEETTLVMNLYCKLPFGKMHQSKPEVIELAGLIGRTPGAVAYKLVNLASLDPSLQARGIKGAKNSSKLDKVVWDKFYNNWDTLPLESEKMLARYKHKTLEDLFPEEEIQYGEGKTRESKVLTRVNQSFFRNVVMASYNYTCCITGISHPSLLVAGHIKPWSVDAQNRLNPQNGIAMNALHDKAFENGLITITPDYVVKVSDELKKQENDLTIQKYFIAYNGKKIIEPSRFLPDKRFLEYHNAERFRG